MDQMLKPAGDAGVRDAMLPLMLTAQMRLPPHLADLPEQERDRAEKSFYSQQSVEYSRLLGHIPIDILKAAADAAVLASPFFPFPADLMKHAGPAFDRRKRESDRIDRLIEHATRPKSQEQPAFVPEPEHVRLLHLLGHYERPGRRLYSPAKARAARARLIELGHPAPGEPPPLDQPPARSPEQPPPPAHAEAHEWKHARWHAGEALYQQRAEEPPPPDDIPEAEVAP